MNRQVPSRSVCSSDRIGSIYVPDVLAQASEREALPDMLYEYLKTTLTIRQYAQSLELRLRQVSFVELHQLFTESGRGLKAVQHSFMAAFVISDPLQCSPIALKI